jgi:hypothetical protein
MEFQVSPQEVIKAQGKVVSQNIYYPTGNESLDEAVYRFSVHFDTALSNEVMAKLKAIPQQTQN